MDLYEHYRYAWGWEVPDEMQAVVLEGRGFENVKVRRVEVPQIGENQLLGRVDAAGVCTSILKVIEQGPEHAFLNGWDIEKWPVILGDEGSVTIVKVGENLLGKYEVGQRYAIQPAVGVGPINHRERYREGGRGMYKCAVGYTLGGNLAEYIRIQEEVLEGGCLVELPSQEMGYYEVSMAEPISCIYSAQERNWHIIKDGPGAMRRGEIGLLRGGVAVVVGAGAMGRMHAEMALRFGPGVLIVSDVVEERLSRTMTSIGEKAAEKGCKLVCVKADGLGKAVKEASGGRGADDIILAVGVREVQQEALSMLADGGVANLFGGLPRGKHVLDLDALAVHYREIKVVGSSGGDPSDMTATLGAIYDGDIDAGNYVAGVGSLDNAVKVLRMIQETRIDGKAILYPHIGKKPLVRVEHWDKEQEMELLRGNLRAMEGEGE
jgi:threonine dehydrogenase-like Zn-dependent dehydrogenase